ncbi:DUF3524 domain-containing protein [Bradymonadaceae bacterium TMQ3]|nr:DUF3524 domain-containing protein [Bradymonadaceae bacterium TMQ3]TXC75277.1 DUF3524 domain-containing protein [Bradymonadales bacterium TMQ1]
MKVLLLSAYHAHSHAQWARGLAENLEGIEVDIRTLPPRHFPWRMRGNALSFAADLSLDAAEYEALLVTSMVDLATLRGLRPELCRLPTAVYFHENQAVYPLKEDRDRAHYIITNLYTAMAADRVIFNSPFNLRTFFEGTAAFLKKMPDGVPSTTLETLRERASVLPVPLPDALFEVAGGEGIPTPERDPHRPLRLVWNHRWEHDKDPRAFFEALFALDAQNVDFRLVVLGPRFRNAPPIFAQARHQLAHRIDHFGYAETRADYLGWLRRCDVVVSTARHEFQGLAVQEAVALGCRPLLPARQAYPDFFEERWLYPSHEDHQTQVQVLIEALKRLLINPEGLRKSSPPDLSILRWERQKWDYARLLNALN